MYVSLNRFLQERMTLLDVRTRSLPNCSCFDLRARHLFRPNAINRLSGLDSLFLGLALSNGSRPPVTQVTRHLRIDGPPSIGQGGTHIRSTAVHSIVHLLKPIYGTCGALW